ncbi:hypothetical protein IFM89_031319 [Coptis chinensis]|uniref:50S ribosomal protein L18, chloroplastic n=1 Tax=Coptis chinensis TaxID=261450 RepID=A0A835J1G7_9MAGN|nr:hypothetical protein IFM89_031319 [Coptis chinensis]
MALTTVPSLLHLKTSLLFQTHSNPFPFIPLPLSYTSLSYKPLVVVQARANTRKESAKVRNRRLHKKFNGSSVRPRLSVFCSDKQLYATLVDDQNKKCLFYGSTLQKSIRDNPSCSTIEAAQRVGEELVKACIDLKINEISSYDRNGFSRGEKMQAFEVAISRHGFLK